MQRSNCNTARNPSQQTTKSAATTGVSLEQRVTNILSMDGYLGYNLGQPPIVEQSYANRFVVVEEEFNKLVKKLQDCGMSLNAISRFLGYPGTNGLRDLESVAAGRSKHYTLAGAIKVLRTVANKQ